MWVSDNHRRLINSGRSPSLRAFHAQPRQRKVEAKPHHVIFALGLEVLEHHGFAAAAGGRPRRTDEDPDEGVHQGRAQALCQAEEVRGLATAHVCPPLVAQQR